MEIKSLSQQRHHFSVCSRGNGMFPETGLYLDTKQAQRDPVGSLWSTGSSYSPAGNAHLCWQLPKGISSLETQHPRGSVKRQWLRREAWAW